jgi:uncharacterized membrane protein YraQ (UPF0718 family)
MEFIADLLLKSGQQVGITFLHNWPFLIASVIIAVGLKLYINPDKVSNFLIRYRKVGVVGATLAAVTTPLCSCGTTAIILGMMASMIPWAPIIAFMVASPLTSPQELIYSAGLFGWPFALAFYISSIVLGLLGGLIGDILERHGWLANQTRFSAPAAANRPAPVAACTCDSTPATVFATRPSMIHRPQFKQPTSILLASANSTGEAGLSLSTCCASPVRSTPAPCECNIEQIPSAAAPCACAGAKIEPVASDCSCKENQATPGHPSVTWRMFLAEALTTGKRLLVMFLGFAFIGYFLNGLIPSAWVAAVFGQGNIYSVPLAATLGLPLYINTEASLPLVRALIDGGMSQGAAMAFLITGAGTSIGAFAGALTIARWRVIATVIGTLWLGAVSMGYLYNFLLISGLF